MALVLCAPAAAWPAQDVDILAAAPRTSIYIEAATRDGGQPGCDWYVPASDFVSSTEADGDACHVEIRIRGIINRDGARLFSEVVEKLRSSDHIPTAIVLDSRGGDADAAITMARLVRGTDLFTDPPVRTRISVGYDAVCFSACVVIFSAGYERELEFDINGDPALPSRIGIHGPGQFDRDRRQYDTSAHNGEIMRVSRRLKDYFRQIGVDTRFVDDMFAVPFDEIRLLSREELTGYGLYGH